MIHLRRVRGVLPRTRRYVLEVVPKAGVGLSAGPVTMSRAAVIRRLEPLVGVDDAIALLDDADWQWQAGDHSTAVEFDEEPEPRPRGEASSGLEFGSWSRTWTDPELG